MAKALYREYRPKTFDQVLGQDRVTNVLRNQVKQEKISHAYLFSGERGTGKTSCAKIFAKAINCLNPKDGSPCLECENCRAIEDETTIDVVEMDAASNRRIDDIRNLKDNVIYPPNKLKYKVYIIDEAHMITREAFNALLKIMEEPPSHLVFILATTELEKIPKTILSRVQRFEFNKIDENQIRAQIDLILKNKNVTMENEAIDLIIKKANGAMRDALSILDQVLSFGETSYGLSDVQSILGVVDFYDIDALTKAIIGKDPKTALEKTFDLRNRNKTNKDIIDSLINYFKDIMVYSLTFDEKKFDNKDRLDFIKERANDISDIDVADYIDILVEYSNKLKLTDNTDALTEVCILRLINLKSINSLESRIRYLEKHTGEDLVDLINKIVDDRLKNIDLNPQRRAPIESKTNPVVENPLIETNNIETPVENEKIVEKPAENIEEKIEDKSLSSNNSLSPAIENQIKDMLLKTAGGVLNQLYKEEGFNYFYDDETFNIIVKEDFYKIFIVTKTQEIEEGLSKILNKTYKLNVADKNYQDNNNKNSKELPIDHTSKLLEVFGDELIIKGE